MKPRTLVTQRLYFGLDAYRLRTATGRVLARVVGLPAERARVSAEHLKHDFGVDTEGGRALVNDLVADGMIAPRPDGQPDYVLTDRFAEYANARVVEPLLRGEAIELVARARELAERINEHANRNPLELEAVATFGCYMSRDPDLEELPLGLVVRSREVSRRAMWRMKTKPDGAEEIRGAFRELSSFVRVKVVTELCALPRPFAVVYRAES